MAQYFIESYTYGAGSEFADLNDFLTTVYGQTPVEIKNGITISGDPRANWKQATQNIEQALIDGTFVVDDGNYSGGYRGDTFEIGNVNNLGWRYENVDLITSDTQYTFIGAVSDGSLTVTEDRFESSLQGPTITYSIPIPNGISGEFNFIYVTNSSSDVRLEIEGSFTEDTETGEIQGVVQTLDFRTGDYTVRLEGLDSLAYDYQTVTQHMGDYEGLKSFLFAGDTNYIFNNGGVGDFIFGNSGNDTFTLLVGDDEAFGSDGNDTFDGGAGNDTLYGGDGDDIINGGDGDDFLHGESFIRTDENNSNDTLNGGAGDDVLVGGEGDDVIDGGEGIDTARYYFYGKDDITSAVVAENGDVTLTSPLGTDILKDIENVDFENGGLISLNELVAHVNAGATLGANIVQGTDGNDTLDSGAGNEIQALAGDDYINLTGGNNIIDGGEGVDTLDIFNSRDLEYFEPSTISYSNQNGVISIDANTIRNVELFSRIGGVAELDSLFSTNDKVINGSDERDVLLGSLGNDEIFAGGGADEVYGYAGDDRLHGGDGDDLIWGDSQGDDYINGGNGDDYIVDDLGVNTIDGGAGDDQIFARGTGANSIDGGDGDDLLVAGAGDDEVFGSDGNDTFHGFLGNDTLYGGDGNDIINGGDGNDFLHGESFLRTDEKDSNDTLNGDAGNDILVGGEGDDVLDGGEGIDTARYYFIGKDDITSAFVAENGDVTVSSRLGIDVLRGIENIDFEIGGTIALSELLEFVTTRDSVEDNTFARSQTEIDSFARIGDTSIIVYSDGTVDRINGDIAVFEEGSITADQLAASKANANLWGDFIPTVYSNPDNPALEALIDLQLIASDEADVVIAAKNVNGVLVDLGTNDFINLGAGDDAAQGGDGNDTLDGGTGSNFLTGGNGADTFFLDGRGGSITWSTVTDFDGDNVNVWGWVEGLSQLLIQEEVAGAGDFKGATFHYDLNGDNAIDTSITFSGLSLDQVPSSSAQVVAENGYLLFA